MRDPSPAFSPAIAVLASRTLGEMIDAGADESVASGRLPAAAAGGC